MMSFEVRFADSVIDVSRGQSDFEKDSIGGSEDPQKKLRDGMVFGYSISQHHLQMAESSQVY